MNAPAGKPEEVVSGPIPPATPRIFFRVFPSVMLPMFDIATFAQKAA